MAEGLVANIWFSLMGWRGSGLVNVDLSPNLAYQAYKFASDELGTARFVQSISTYPGVIGQSFQREGTAIWVLWSADGAPHAVELPITPTAIYSNKGEIQSVSSTLELTSQPMYVFWED
jgi:hypothetical protein